MRIPLIFAVLLSFSLIIGSACTKTSFITSPDALVITSEDTIHFDTVFTSTGSVTHFFKLYNRNNQKLKIASITLNGGKDSYFTINADGREGPTVEELDMEANDSLYVFVTVNIDPSGGNLPFIVGDSIRIRFNGNEKQVHLQAWGQDAVFLRNGVITENTTWTNEKPYVITGGLLVSQNTTLTIEKGARIYLHADAPVFIDGTLRATGEQYDSTLIVFRGDRLDEYYRDYPGAWPGLYFRAGSKNNLLRHVVIKNAYQGVVAQEGSTGPGPKLTLRQCLIDNCYDAGIIGVRSDIDAENCVISNCGKNIMLLGGGRYLFTHCTDVAISNNYIPHKEPVLRVTDFIKEDDAIAVGELEANFTNCIFWGDNGTVEDEVIVDRQGNSTFTAGFRNCLWKNMTDPQAATGSGMISNQDPLFSTVDTRNRVYDFRLKEGSPAIGAGIPSGTLIDFDENARDPLNPDLGAFETNF